MSTGDEVDRTMFALLSKVAEILASHVSRLLDGRKQSRDVDVAAQLAEILLALQVVCVRGDRILQVVDRLCSSDATEDDPAALNRLLDEQVDGLDELRRMMNLRRSLLATVDVELYIDLAPIIDDKSGLLTRWQQQVAQSRLSTTTLFFLPAEQVQHVLDVGRARATGGDLDVERIDHVLLVAKLLREVRAGEIRDIRHHGDQAKERVMHDVRTARADVSQAKALCAGLFASMEKTIGADAMAGLRRRQLRERS